MSKSEDFTKLNKVFILVEPTDHNNMSHCLKKALFAGHKDYEYNCILEQKLDRNEKKTNISFSQSKAVKNVHN